jgi:hypothetical protein
VEEREGEEREGYTMSERGRGIHSEGERGVDVREREREGVGCTKIRGGMEEESERGVVHQIHIFFLCLRRIFSGIN